MNKKLFKITSYYVQWEAKNEDLIVREDNKENREHLCLSYNIKDSDFINGITPYTTTGELSGDWDSPCEIEIKVFTQEEYNKILLNEIDQINEVLFKE